MAVNHLLTFLLLGLGGLAVLVMVGFWWEQRFQQRLQQALARQKTELQTREQALQAEQQRLAAAQAQFAEEQDLWQAGEREQWREQLQAQLTREHAEQLAQHEARVLADKHQLSAQILSQTLQSQAASHTRAQTRLDLELPEDTQLRGRLIGKGGRNIQAFQQVSGVDMSLGEDRVTLSCFDPFKLAVAENTVKALLQMQRVSPERIAQVYEAQQQQLEKSLPRLAQEAARRAGLKEPLDARLLQAMGRLNYRTSAGQNLLLHAQEVAQLAGIMAQELGVDEALARRGGFLHDVGKALPETPDSGTHAMRGVALARQAGESEAVLHVIGAHHRETPPQTPEAFLVQAADALSAARPGVRSEKNDWQGARVQQLETLIQGFEGVDRVVVLRAGHEVRVMVDPDEVSDEESQILGHRIAEAVRQAEPDLRMKLSMIREWKGSHYV